MLQRKLKELVGHLGQWLERFQKAKEAVPEVQKIKEQAEWLTQVVEERPPEVLDISTGPLEERIDQTHKFVLETLPMLPEVDPRSITFATSTSTFGTDSAVTFLMLAGERDSPRAKEYTDKQQRDYEELQRVQKRFEEVRDRMRKVLPMKVIQLELAYQTYYAAKSGIGERTAAALEMRTLLDQVQGELFQKAQRNPRENMTWETMAERLQPDLVPSNLLKAQKQTRSDLVDELSVIAKQREGISTRDLNVVWTRWLDHLYIVLGLLY